MKKYIIIPFVLLILLGCTYNVVEQPNKPRWSYIKSPAGVCYEYNSWFLGYHSYTISSPVNEKYCK